jgi:hypothetical protein
VKRIQLNSTVPVSALAALVLLAALGGCSQKSPLEQMIENRSRYSAELNGFFVEETPIVVEATGEEMPAEGEFAAEEGDEMEMPTDLDFGTSPAVDQRAQLDILLKHDSFEKLPGITVDITQVDAGMNQKGRWLLWLDTANVERANPTQYSHVIEDLEYVEGDAFSVEVRHPIPEGERGDYKEFEGLE